MAWDLRGNIDDEIEPRPARRDAAARAGRAALPGVPVRRATGRSSRAADRATATAATGATDAEPRRSGPPRGRRPCARRRSVAGVDGAADAARPARAGIGSNSWVVSRRRTPLPASRCWPTTRTSAPALPSHLVPDGPALPHGQRGVPVRRRRVHLLRRARCRDRAQRRRSPGASPTSAPTSPTSYLEKVDGDTLPVRGQAGRPRRPGGDHQGRRARSRGALRIRSTVTGR